MGWPLLLAAVVTPADAVWPLVSACPRVVTRFGDGGTGTGVTVAVRDGFAYVLTAAHAVPGPADREVQFFDRRSYPVPSRTYRGVEVVARLADPDLAVLRVRVGDNRVSVLPPAPPGERPKRFPFPAGSVGCADGGPPILRGERVTGKKLARRPGGGVAFFWETADPPVPGRSGGPLLDGRGRVIGVCAAGRDGVGYFAHADEILVAMKREGLGWVWGR